MELRHIKWRIKDATANKAGIGNYTKGHYVDPRWVNQTVCGRAIPDNHLVIVGHSIEVDCKFCIRRKP